MNSDPDGPHLITCSNVWYVCNEVVLELVETSIDSNSWVSEEVGSKRNTTKSCNKNRSFGPSDEVEVVMSPESSKESSLTDNTLLLSSVDAAGVCKTELNPVSLVISMCIACLIISKMHVVNDCGFSCPS